MDGLKRITVRAFVRGNRAVIEVEDTGPGFNDLNRANKNKYVSKFLTKPLLKEPLEAINF